MKIIVYHARNLVALGVLLASSIIAVPVQAEEKNGDKALEEIVVTGSRGKPRTVSDSPVPVDVFNDSTIESVSYSDTNDVLKTLVPSYNIARQPISDGATFIRPAKLRGLPTDKTLVLVNSKRRHRAALVTIGGSGTQGPDLATIPTIAIKHIEVLRDGAAAQYGSDAIAGVINFILKDNASGGSASIDTGENTEGDGLTRRVQGNIGLPIFGDGFVSLSAEWDKTDATIRAEQYCGSWFCLDKNNPTYDPNAWYASFVNDPTFAEAVAAMGPVVQPWGQPNSDGARFFFNAGVPLKGDTELYAFGNYSKSSSDGGFFYRYPYNGTIEDLRTPDGSIYNPLEKYPGGFTPRFFGDVYDYSLVGGIRGAFPGGMTYDLSARAGNSKIAYTLKNTINPSLGPDSAESFHPGDLINKEAQLQADFTTEFATGMQNPLALAFGASYMKESYDIVGGEPDSYEAGPYAVADPWGFCNAGTPTAAGMAVIANGSSLDCANPDDPVFNVVGVGSNGFPGYSPAFSDSYDRHSYALYADVSQEITDKLFLEGAVRYEDYSDFGSKTVGKLAGLYKFNETFGFRASIGTGFRAPTPGQQGTTNVSTRLPNGFPVATGLFPASSPVAAALGATPLKPETSTNIALGFTADFERLSMTVDYYNIKVADRTNAVSTLGVSTDPGAGSAYDNYVALVNAGVSGAETIGGVFYFTNAFDTTTEGVDVVATYPVEWAAGLTTMTLSFNYNSTKFDTDPSAYLNAEDQYDFIHNEPKWRSVLSAQHEAGKLSAMARLNLYGPYENSNTGGNPLRIQTFDPIVFVDLEGAYRLTDTLTVAVGGRNIFDQYPEKDAIGDFCCGRLYSSATSVDWQGAFYYARMTANF